MRTTRATMIALTSGGRCGYANPAGAQPTRSSYMFIVSLTAGPDGVGGTHSVCDVSCGYSSS